MKIFIISIGFFLLVFGVYFFVLSENFIVGGLESSLIFLDKLFFYRKKHKKQEYFFSNNNSIIIFRILIILLFGFLIGNINFFISTVIFNFSFSFVIKMFDHYNLKRDFIINKMPDLIKNNKFFKMSLCSIIIGIFLGIGCGLIFANNCSTGGTDVIFLYIQNKFKLNLKNILLCIDGIMILISFYLDFSRNPEDKKSVIIKYIFSCIAFIIAIFLIDLMQKI
ncbi:YitT family protein [Candidatus Phytoplasma palmae]|uniref:YitT family protein n=1 Tax=Candidatus Phytoplasma palmae TaxID=85624 RepID=UPI003990D6B7